MSYVGETGWANGYNDIIKQGIKASYQAGNQIKSFKASFNKKEKKTKKEKTLPDCRFWDIEQAASYWGYCSKTLRQLVKQNRVPYNKKGKKYLFPIDEFKECVNSNNIQVYNPNKRK